MIRPGIAVMIGVHTLCSLLAAGCRGTTRDVVAGSPPDRPPASSPAVRFVDVTRTAGIHFRHTNGRSGRFYFPETAGSGCGFLDYNNDGKLDLFFVNGSRLPGYPQQGPLFSALYRNNGGGRFTDVTQAAGLAVDCYGMGVAVADYDADGYQDLLLTALGSCHLFHNQGDGRFREVTRAAGVGQEGFWTSAAFLDYDRDGWLDLYVGNYCRWSPQTNKLCPDGRGGKKMCGPTSYRGLPSVLYRNNGDGTFADVTKAAGLHETVGKALGIAVWDYDGNGWLDMAIARDKEPNSLYRNRGDGTFVDVALEVGIAYSMTGVARSGMGIDTADITNSGRESILIGNIDTEGLALFTPDANGQFTDTADAAGLFGPSLPMSTFGALFVDYDGDGLKDCVTANGHVDEKVHVAGSNVSYKQNLLVFHNEGGGTFQEVGASLGPVFGEKRVWRGLAYGDWDSDGDPDLLLSTCGGAPALLRNDGGNSRSWLQVQALGALGNRQGIGARVTVLAGGVRQTGWIRTGTSYGSQHELTAFFGLGAAREAAEVEVRFASGKREVVAEVEAGQLIVVEEGKGLVAQGPPGSPAVRRLPPLRRPTGKA
jgi:hypothetical protein